MNVVAAVTLILFVAQGVVGEQEALQKPGMMAAMLALLGVAAVAIRWRIAVVPRSDEEGLQSEEKGTPAVLELGLYRDGAVLGSRSPDPPS